MFKRIASEALGLSDIGIIVPPSDYDKVESDDYILHEDGEKIFFLIKSKQDEYCFTNRALIHVDGNSALNKKRLLKRYEYYKHPIGGVTLETAGNIDFDVEIKFYMGNADYSDNGSLKSGGGLTFSIDVDKKQIKQLADLYKALYTISLIVGENYSKFRTHMESLEKALPTVVGNRSESVNKVEELKRVHEYILAWIESGKEKYLRKDFSEVFLKYINN
jgi:hypothetical protein